MYHGQLRDCAPPGLTADDRQRMMLKASDKSQYLTRPRIPNLEVNLLWDVAYYDLPLEGVAEWQGVKYWFATIAEEIPDQKEFFLLRLPSAEMRKVEEIQRLREDIIDAGNRHDLRHATRWDWSTLRGEIWKHAYEKSQQVFQAFSKASAKLPQPDFSMAEVIGWCYWKEPEPIQRATDTTGLLPIVSDHNRSSKSQ